MTTMRSAGPGTPTRPSRRWPPEDRTSTSWVPTRTPETGRLTGRRWSGCGRSKRSTTPITSSASTRTSSRLCPDEDYPSYRRLRKETRMKVANYVLHGRAGIGVRIDDERVAPAPWKCLADLFAEDDPLAALLAFDPSTVDAIRPERLLAPTVERSYVIGTGANYPDHVAEA